LLGNILRLHRAEKTSRHPRAYHSFAIRRALRWIDRSVAEPIAIPKLAKVAGLSVSRFRERFFDEVGFSPSSYVCRCRVEQAKRHLRQNSIPVTAIAHELGFSSSQYFATVFKRMEGLTPLEFRNRAVREKG
jgi:AraC-like DNA-binding protein